ncbi:MAG: HTTM domain-containing protein [Planctomycetaceae bacterium]|nr:HTTM domain-containing protein [Planctomycetaceae bacterium]
MNPARAWNAFWFGPVSARPLGLFRIVFGLVTLANLAFLSFEMDYWLTDVGLLQGTEALEVAGPSRPSPLNWVQDPTSMHVFFAATAAVAVLVTIGWRTRLMSILLYLMMLSIHHHNVLTSSGADTLVMIITFYVMLCPCGAAYSLDARREARRRGIPAEPLILPWSQRLIQLQISLIYFNTAILKCNGVTWLNGTALHYVLNNSEVGYLRLDPLTQYPVAVNILTYGAVLIEFALAFLLWFRATRPWTIIAGLALHGGVHLMVNIPIFGEMMAACYICFLQPDEVDVVLRRLNPAHWFRRPPHSTVAATIPGRVDSPSALTRPHLTEAACRLAPEAAKHDD